MNDEHESKILSESDTPTDQAPVKGKSCLGVWLMAVMVIGMLAWTILVVGGYFHHAK